jgi:predicted Rossmann-fold nucleotide-binding protein
MMSADDDIFRLEILSMSDERAVHESVRRAIFQLWEVVDNLARLQARHERYRVSIFGSSRVPPESPLYGEVRRLARELAVMGCSIATGGGSGLMQAANEGATLGGADDEFQSMAVCIDGDICGHPNPYVRRSHTHHTFFSRLHHFVHLSDAFVAVPGGIGTLMEAMMVWQLLQARKLHGTPLILVGPMWAELVDWTRAHMLATEPAMVEPVDLTIPICVADVDAALAVIRQHRDAWARNAAEPQASI